MGAGIARGWVDSGSFGGGVDTVNISVFKRIVLAWVITIFCSGGVSMALYSVLRIIFINSDLFIPSQPPSPLVLNILAPLTTNYHHNL